MALIARCFATGEQARNAYDALLGDGFTANNVALLTPNSSDTVAAARAGSVLGSQTNYFLNQLDDNGGIVVVYPPFGAALKASNIMEKYGPTKRIEDESISLQQYVPFKNNPAPLSSLLGISVLIKSSKQVSSMRLRPRSLSFISRWFKPLMDPNYALSNAFGMKLLSGGAAPLSSMFGMGVKFGKSGDDFTSSFGVKLLMDDAAPASSMIGMPTLSGDRTSK